MTNDYKDKLLKYLTGNITSGSKSSTPYYVESTKHENNEITGLGFNKYQVIDTLYCKNAKGEYNGNVIVYGNGTTNNSTWNGFIVLLDNKMNLLKIFKNYDTGTSFDIFEKLNIDEQGQVFGIDYSNNQHRLILLNNLSEKGNLPDYKCILRQSYFLQGNITNTYFDTDNTGVYSNLLSVDKSKQSALYFITGMDGGRDLLYGTSFRINVGSTNEWTEYTDGVLYGGMFLASFVSFDINDNVNANLFFEEDTNNGQITRVSNSGTSLSQYTQLVQNLSQYVTNVVSVTAIILNKDKFYFGLGGYTSSKTKVSVYLYQNTNVIPVYEIEENGVYQNGYVRANFIHQNNLTFVVASIGNGIDDDEIYGDVYVNLLNDENINYEVKLEDSIYLNNQIIISLSNAFNIYSVLVGGYPLNSSDYYTYVTTYIHRNGYNGEEYEGNSSLLPQQGILKDSQDNLVFARDLYNYKVYNNYAISTLNVPNTYLNGIEIGNELLLSDTNTTLIDKSLPIEKNIYEDLNINFNNQIKMQNRNQTNYVDNYSGASRLNQSASKILDYNNAKATKIKVNLSDDTSYITSASTLINNGKCTYTIGVKVPSSVNVDTIEIISEDETTTYQTISNLNLENNKYYVISQDVYVE